MIALVRSEFRKFRSTRMWWILLIVLVAYMAFTAGAVAAMYIANGTLTSDASASGTVNLDPRLAPSNVYTVAASFGYIFPALIGVMSFTNEFRHKTITPTFIATPNRTKVLLAKLISGIPMGIVYGVLGTFACVGAGALVLSLGDISPQLGTGYAWEIIGRSILALTMWLMFGVALGSVITNQTVAVVVLIAFTQLVEPLLRMILSVWTPTQGIAKFLPGAVGDSIAGGSLYSTITSSNTFSLWQALIVMLAYIAILAVIGRATTLRRDVG